MRILIGEDNRFFRRLLEVNLKQWGHEVVTCEDGKQAWSALQQEDAPKLAILDWEMPEMDGVQICREVRKSKDGPYVYIIILTAKNRRDDLVQGLESGADDFISKPFDPVELQMRLRAGIRIVKLQDDLMSAYRAADLRAKEDSLTGFWNYSAIIEILKKELARSARERTYVGVIMADVDNFKRINDLYGHPHGDRVLKRITKTIRSGLRTYDCAGRYGGEEFLMVLPGCEQASASKLAERLRVAVENESAGAAERGGTLTMSFGVTSVSGVDGVTADMAITMADEALYRAKRRGRNCVESVRFRPKVASGAAERSTATESSKSSDQVVNSGEE